MTLVGKPSTSNASANSANSSASKMNTRKCMATFSEVFGLSSVSSSDCRCCCRSASCRTASCLVHQWQLRREKTIMTASFLLRSAWVKLTNNLSFHSSSCTPPAGFRASATRTKEAFGKKSSSPLRGAPSGKRAALWLSLGTRYQIMTNTNNNKTARPTRSRRDTMNTSTVITITAGAKCSNVLPQRYIAANESNASTFWPVRRISASGRRPWPKSGPPPNSLHKFSASSASI
mmetsp:Transcript_16237/g.37412  ORF Transcript_16237/g.37412 Transcript_16237/m.37412 type:complete len:233 (-) Transcript_16237:276-974(-)